MGQNYEVPETQKKRKQKTQGSTGVKISPLDGAAYQQVLSNCFNQNLFTSTPTLLEPNSQVRSLFSLWSQVATTNSIHCRCSTAFMFIGSSILLPSWGGRNQITRISWQLPFCWQHNWVLLWWRLEILIKRNWFKPVKLCQIKIHKVFFCVLAATSGELYIFQPCMFLFLVVAQYFG